MAQLNGHSLGLAVITLVSFASHVHADGLVYRLPADGTWVRYRLSEQGHLAIVFPANMNVPPALKNAQELPIKSTGSLVLRSVGQQDLDGQSCRWIELELEVRILSKLPDPATGELQAKKEDRHIVLKMLIPEKYLSDGADPMTHVQRLYLKDGEKEPESVDDEKAKQYELDRFRPLFPAPAQEVQISKSHSVDTQIEDMGTLECKRLAFESKYEGPLARGRRGWWCWQGRHEVCLHEKIPFGVASLTFAVESHEWSGDKERSPRATVKSTKEMVVTEIGAAATSKMPELN